jgi:ketosteroid isomerase-like protein
MQQGKRPRKHEHKIKSITIIGPVAYEIGDVLDITADGSQRHSEVMNIFAKEDTGWKLVQSVPMDNIQRTLQSFSSPETEKQVRQTALEFAGLFQLENRDPFTRLGEILDNNVVAVTSQGQLLQGRDNVLQTYRQSWQQTLSEFQSFNTRYDIQSVKVSDEGAVVFGKIVINGRFRESGKEFKRSVWETLILRKVSGQWRIIQEHSTAAGEIAPPACRAELGLSVNRT